jgi:molybdate transport system permease protein
LDWSALKLSLYLALATSLILLPFGAFLARLLAWSSFKGKWIVEAALALPLILPPTVLGYYLLVALGSGSPLGAFYETLTGHPLAFSFEGLVLASVLVNTPFALIPMQRAFEAIPLEVQQAARVCGMAPLEAFFKVELPLAWPGVLSGVIMTAAHTVGEFGVVLMVGGSIPGETKTVAIAIYDRVQAFDMQAAGWMSAMLLALSLLALAFTVRLGRKELR